MGGVNNALMSTQAFFALLNSFKSKRKLIFSIKDIYMYINARKVPVAMRFSVVLQEAYKLWELLTVNDRIRTCIHRHLFQCRESLFQNL